MDLKLMQTHGKRLIKSELIEVIIPANLTGVTKRRFELPDNANLRNTYIWHIETFIVTDTPYSIISDTLVVGFAMLRNSFLTLQGYDGDNFVWQKPMIDLRTMLSWATVGATNSEMNPNNFSGQRVNYPKSYIEIADPSLISTQDNQSILMEVYYSEMSALERKDDKKSTFKNRS